MIQTTERAEIALNVLTFGWTGIFLVQHARKPGGMGYFTATIFHDQESGEFSFRCDGGLLPRGAVVDGYVADDCRGTLTVLLTEGAAYTEERQASLAGVLEALAPGLGDRYRAWDALRPRPDVVP